MKYAIGLVISFVFVIYNAVAIATIWNMWLMHWHHLTMPEAFGVMLMGSWTRSWKPQSKADYEWNALQGMKYELVQPAALVALSYAVRYIYF